MLASSLRSALQRSGADRLARNDGDHPSDCIMSSKQREVSEPPCEPPPEPRLISTLNTTSELEEDDLEALLLADLGNPDEDEQAESRPQAEPSPRADDDHDALFALMAQHWPGDPRPLAVEPEPPAKTRRRALSDSAGDEAATRHVQRRVEASGAAHPGEDLTTGTAVPSTAGTFWERRLCTRPEEDVERPPPPEKVAEAYGRLQLPLTASVREVERKFRALARHAHPDKVEKFQRAKAEWNFRELHQAKRLVVSWIKGHSVEEDTDGSGALLSSEDESLSPDDAHATALGGCAKDADNAADSGSDSEEKDERHQDMQAAEVRPFLWYGPEPVSEGERDDSDSDDSTTRRRCQPLGGEEVAVAPEERARISTEENALEQAMALSRHISAAAVFQGRERLCSECWSRAPQGDGDKCRPCILEERRILRRLDGARSNDAR